MIKERTKFYNEADRNHYCDLVMREYLSQDLESKQALNSSNLALLRRLNDTLEKAVDCRKFLMVLTLLFNGYEGGDVYARRCMFMLTSVKKQFRLLYLIKAHLRVHTITSKYSYTITHVIDNFETRVQYLLSVVREKHITASPLQACVEEFDSFYNNIVEICKDIELGEILGHARVLTYVQALIDEYPDDGTWKREDEMYKQARERRAAYNKKVREEDRARYMKAVTDDALAILYEQADQIRSLLRCHNPESDHAVMQFLRHMEAVTNPKLFMFATVCKGVRPRPRYYCADGKSLLTSILSKATIVESDTPIPEPLETEVNAGKLAFIEVLLT